MRRVIGRGVSRRREWIELGEIFLEGGMRTETSLRAALRDTLARLHPALHDIQWVPEDCSHQSRPRARGHLLGHVSSRPPDFEGTRTLSHGPEAPEARRYPRLALTLEGLIRTRGCTTRTKPSVTPAMHPPPRISSVTRARPRNPVADTRGENSSFVSSFLSGPRPRKKPPQLFRSGSEQHRGNPPGTPRATNERPASPRRSPGLSIDPTAAGGRPHARDSCELRRTPRRWPRDGKSRS